MRTGVTENRPAHTRVAISKPDSARLASATLGVLLRRQRKPLAEIEIVHHFAPSFQDNRVQETHHAPRRSGLGPRIALHGGQQRTVRETRM